LNPNNSEAWTEKGEALEEQGKVDDALDCFERAIDANPKNEIAHKDKGLALLKIDMSEEALR
ncbi:MAG: tetratricopeptide repeat protein, partial [Thermoplasmata archaeon]|nr:tetratricopeptide repeat protein [Thermoplasmata archaeon]NIS10702.1 tetratricopeptide repeat protein [Thermoplasmata archaeon]NIS18648.1 tetratricopeptide repeat protein [Thermoplasmata archaeon]NIT75655.1 tetratricopeptide repeat protein [Thermoplasmata archaeon]NIU47806.1 tetratricopeptide repeat protein [Thermoplasmata archaeon]